MNVDLNKMDRGGWNRPSTSTPRNWLIHDFIPFTICFEDGVYAVYTEPCATTPTCVEPTREAAEEWAWDYYCETLLSDAE
jgi:hypothetical protein